MVETLTVILLVFVLYHLPRLARLRSAKQRVRDAIVAGTGGLIMSLLILASASVDLPADVSRQLADNSVIKAYGRNVVNVILVDYRALDTLGEIVVVAVAGIGVYALLRLRPQPSEQTAIGTESDSSNRTGGEERS
jgi:multicomponent Na+:H+ antiporter subunit A